MMATQPPHHSCAASNQVSPAQHTTPGKVHSRNDDAGGEVPSGCEAFAFCTCARLALFARVTVPCSYFGWPNVRSAAAAIAAGFHPRLAGPGAGTALGDQRNESRVCAISPGNDGTPA